MNKNDELQWEEQSKKQNKDSSLLSLQELLSQNDVQLMQLFSIEGIQHKIKSKIVYFMDFCLSHEQFTISMINVGIKCPIHEGTPQHSNMKTICYVASDILTCQHDAVIDLFIRKTKSAQIFKQEEQNQIYEDITCSVQIQAAVQQKFKYLKFMLQYLKQDKIDENCLNYLMKVLGGIIRKKVVQLFSFLKQQPWIIQSCLKLVHNPCICSFLGKILGQDETQCKYNDLKKNIIQFMLQKLRLSVNCQSFALKFEFMQQLFKNNYYSATDDRSELQLLSDVVVNREQLNFYLQKILNYDNAANIQELINAQTYLILVINRMNTDEQPQMQSYNTPRKKQPTLNYEADEVFTAFYQIVALLKNKLSLKQQNSVELQNSRKNTLQLLHLMSSNSHFQMVTKKKNSIKISLMMMIEQFFQQPKGGIQKFHMQFIMEKIISKIKSVTEKSKQNIEKQNKNVSRNSNKNNEIIEGKLNDIKQLGQQIEYNIKLQEKSLNKQQQDLNEKDWSEIFQYLSKVLIQTNLYDEIKSYHMDLRNIHRYNRNENISYINKLFMILDSTSRSININEKYYLKCYLPFLNLQNFHKLYTSKLGCTLNLNQRVKIPLQFNFIKDNSQYYSQKQLLIDGKKQLNHKQFYMSHSEDQDQDIKCFGNHKYHSNQNQNNQIRNDSYNNNTINNEKQNQTKLKLNLGSLNNFRQQKQINKLKNKDQIQKSIEKLKDQQQIQCKARQQKSGVEQKFQVQYYVRHMMIS